MNISVLPFASGFLSFKNSIHLVCQVFNPPKTFKSKVENRKKQINITFERNSLKRELYPRLK
jgi:hypothetical protein